MTRPLALTRVDGVSVVTAPENLDVYSAQEVRDTFGALIRNGHHRLVADMTGTSFMDQTGLAALVGILHRIRAHDGALALACDRELILKVFAITGLDQVFVIRPDVAAAADAIRETADAVPEIYVRPVAYDVSVFPDALRADPSSALDADTWKISVEWRGGDTWAVCRHGRRCLGADGEWDYEPQPSSREGDWLATHRFPLDAALDLARAHAPKIRINGMTALEILERHRA